MSRSGAYYVVSVSLHGLLLLLGLSFQFFKPSHLLGDSQYNSVQSYIYQGDHLAAPAPEQKHDKSMADRVKQSLTGVLKRADKAKPAADISTKAAVSSQGHSRGESADALLTLLHAAIQRQQQYPPAAMALERQGRVTVSFILLPDGRISGLAVSKSSGTESLDQAALSAVSSAAPFAGVAQYVAAPRPFSIDVVFELG